MRIAREKIEKVKKEFFFSLKQLSFEWEMPPQAHVLEQLVPR